MTSKKRVRSAIFAKYGKEVVTIGHDVISPSDALFFSFFLPRLILM